MAEESYAFPTAVEGLLKGLGSMVGPSTLAKLKGAGLDLEHLPPAIPAVTMTRYIHIVATDIFPNETEDEALHRLGMQFLRGWQRTLVGAAASTFLKVIGPQRSLQRLDRAFRTQDNYTSATAVMVNPKEALVFVNDIQQMPTYWLGIWEGSLEFMGLKGTVTIHEQNPPGASFRLTWS